MARNKKHSKTEIATLLAEADQMASQGKVQNEIANKLGISVMTLHRWRKASVERNYSPGVQSEEIGQNQRSSELQLENLRLRRLVTDLLLEKIKLEEMIGRKNSSAHQTRKLAT